MTRASLAVLFACLLGIPVGVGAFTFVYAKGFSYLSPDPYILGPAPKPLWSQSNEPLHAGSSRP